MMKLLFVSLLVMCSILACKSQQPAAGLPDQTTTPKFNTGKTKFGALIKPPNQQGGGVNFKISVARKLGLTCLREGVNLDNPRDKPIFNSGFDIVLNVNMGVSADDRQTPFAKDTVRYKQQLQTQLSVLKKKPVLLVIENEENNQRYHGGTAQDYLNQLKAAVTVAHTNGLPVTNGGITFPAIMYLTYTDYLEHGKKKEAADFLQRSELPLTAPWLANRKDFLQQLITGYAKTEIDFVNFHWYGKNGDTKTLVEVVNYLQRVTGKPAITNEIGQHDATRETVIAILKTCRQMGLRYAIWYSGDGGTGNERENGVKAIALQNEDGSLRTAGEAFKTGSREE